ncbi:hypothetical protein COO58_13380 [Micromonospora sp. WMMA1996]|uniref:hypothetical protein n=1 Tax=Micromonospora sp. WMMA1996 TaxID=2039878 RepID=UPI000BF7EE77|nr:hypothetical protein [Micromonospora sp. WMMA1996]PGH45306.1 hypothetical protein COO58_13380 [Micromonospora sp. WMMA1996]
MCAVAGFCFKTTWLAVRARTVREVADALDLRERETLDWATGTDRAYRQGVYVAEPVPGWVLAHGRLDLPPGLDTTEPGFRDWLRELSRTLGEVQFFVTERVPEYHLWARAVNGDLLRAYCYIGERGEVPLVVGEPTVVEIERNVGVRRREPGMEHWSDDEWDRWHEAMPNEFDVMAIAGGWSVDPSRIDDATVTGDGIFGRPPTGPKGTWRP